jgi:large subunit ribosomal protein L21
MTDKNLAVVKINNQQYLMQEGEILTLEKIDGEVNKTLEVTDVLLKVIKGKIEVGTPIVSKSKVSLEVLEQKKGEKVKTLVYKAKSRYRKHYGQRQEITVVKVVKII